MRQSERKCGQVVGYVFTLLEELSMSDCICGRKWTSDVSGRSRRANTEQESVQAWGAKFGGSRTDRNRVSSMLDWFMNLGLKKFLVPVLPVCISLETVEGRSSEVLRAVLTLKIVGYDHSCTWRVLTVLSTAHFPPLMLPDLLISSSNLFQSRLF